ncbi:MAG: threonine synthase, partial [Thermoplasmatota archaeon]
MKCECGGIQDVKNDFSSYFEELLNRKEMDAERYLEFMPVKSKYIPDLTPPITPNIKKKIDGIGVIFKLEYLMPSGSFKDRGTYVTMAKLKE